MKRGREISFVILFLVVLSFSFVSAGFFGDLFGKKVSFSPEEPTRGDVNKDGLINSKDVEDLTNHIFVTYTAPDPLWLGDMNRDGELSIIDPSLLVDLTRYQRGDLNKDGKLSQEDADMFADYLHAGNENSAPVPLDLGDLNYE